MPLNHATQWYAISDLKLSKLTADPSTGTPTYATSIDVPGAKSMGIDPDINTVSLRGDNVELANNSTLRAFNITVAHAKISLDILSAIIGGTVSDTGTTPAQVAKWALTQSTAVFAPFKLEGKSPTAGVDSSTGDGHWVLWKCTLTGLSGLGFAEEDYAIPGFTCRAVPLTSNGAWVDGVINETAVAIT